MVPNRLLGVGVVLLLAGCSGDPAGRLGEELQTTAHSFALLTLRIAAPADELPGASGGARWELSATAHLARYRALDPPQVARLLALPLDPQRELPPLNACAFFDAERVAEDDVVARDDEGEIDLLEAGEIRLAAPAPGLALHPRSFAGLLPFVSGTVYEEAQGSVAAGFDQPYELSAAGGATVGSFVARAPAPLVPSVVVSARPPPKAGSVAAVGGGGSALELRWPVERGAADTMYLELRSGARPGGPALRCNVIDLGHFLLPAGLLETLDPAGGESLRLEAARLHRVPVHAPGLGSAELRIFASQSQALPAR